MYVHMYMYFIDTSGSGVRVVLTDVTDTETTVIGLTPAVYYTFLVTAENDVSFQDSNVNVRSASVTATIEEGGKNTLQKVIVTTSVCMCWVIVLFICVSVWHRYTNVVSPC